MAVISQPHHVTQVVVGKKLKSTVCYFKQLPFDSLKLFLLSTGSLTRRAIALSTREMKALA